MFEVRANNDKREDLVKKLEVFTDSVWASDQTTRKSTSGAVNMAEGMRLHAHSSCQASVALRSCEAEVTAASEGIKESLLLQKGVDVLQVWELKSRCTAVRHTRSSIDEELDAYEWHRFENLVASRLDCCGRCDIEEDIANTELGGHVDAYTGARKNWRCFCRWWVSGVAEIVIKSATRQYKPVPNKGWDEKPCGVKWALNIRKVGTGWNLKFVECCRVWATSVDKRECFRKAEGACFNQSVFQPCTTTFHHQQHWHVSTVTYLNYVTLIVSFVWTVVRSIRWYSFQSWVCCAVHVAWFCFH